MKACQQPLRQLFEKANKYSSDHPKVKALNNKITEFFALDRCGLQQADVVLRATLCYA